MYCSLTCFYDKTLQTPPHVRSFSCAYEVAQSPHEPTSGANTRSVLARFCDNNWEKGGFCKKKYVKKPRVKEGGERERAPDDVFGI